MDVGGISVSNNGNITSTRQKQLIYVAPVVVLNGITDLVLIEPETEGAMSTGEGSFKVEEFVQPDGDSISFIGVETRNISQVSIAASDISCNPPGTMTIDVSPSDHHRDDAYTYTATGTGTRCCNV